MIEIPKIQYITRDNDALTHAEQARRAFNSGIKGVQLRMKNSTRAEMIKQGNLALSYANSSGGMLIINDSVDIAKEINAHGVHLGLKDKPVDEARLLAGDGFIIGGTANTLEDVIHQIQKGADYVGLGPFRYTTTKKNLSPVLGFEGCTSIVKALNEQGYTIPLVAVGGITQEDIPALVDVGVSGVAVSKAVFDRLMSAAIS